ncbi:MAG: hypothetical protein SOZ89_05720 [Peptoniphilaceae bacterium]|nr:hypothetical protein [Peptoniphilaceae bacterium]MDY3738603.1 hypothetical protein [Peptoniphilaceae bacterium]
MKKKKYNYSAVLILTVISFILTFALSSIFKNSILSYLLSIVVSFGFQFAITASLLYSPNASLGEYFNKFNLIDVKSVIIGVLTFVIQFLVLVLSVYILSIFYKSYSLEILIIPFIILLVLNILVYILFFYQLFYVIDNRNKNLSIFKLFVNATEIGASLFGKTLLQLLKYLIGLLFIPFVNKYTFFIGLALMFIYIIAITPVVLSRCSFAYKEYTNFEDNK